jgi:hypothetical protein
MHPISFSMEKSSVKIKDMRNKKERERQKRKRRMGCDSHTKSLGPRGLLPLWSQVRALWLLI